MLLLVDKPQGITSHDVVDHVRRVYGERRVGHAGTLDPLATGLLIVAVGREDTKRLKDITLNTTKSYDAEITLGQATDTDDAEGAVIATKPVPDLTENDIISTLRSFLGETLQTPPIYSAIKLNGKKAYELSRKGQVPLLAPRKVNIYDISFISFNPPILNITVTVSAGTYIRSLARDIGEKLNTHAHISALRRTKIGEFDVANATQLSDLKKYT